MLRVDRVTGETMSIRPQAAPGEPPLRFHWDTPMIHSPHDPKVLYVAANKVFRSVDRGLSWAILSPDLTTNQSRDEIATMGVKGSEINLSRNDGIAAWPTIVALAESPKRAGVLYAGTDDGNLQVSRDTGKTWTNVIERVAGVPKGIYVSEVVPSRFDEGTVYATFDGHRQNDYETYIYASTDYGQTWRSIAANLKGEVARTLTEDLKNPDVLYLGTETGLFVSLDRGRAWTRIKANLPTVRIDEITLHPRDNAMLLATHGRAIWILDHLEPIQEYSAAQTSTADARLFTLPPQAMHRRPAADRNYEFWGDQTFFGENPPQAAVISWLLKKQVGEIKLRIADATGREVREISGQLLANSNTPGIQSACWDLRVQPAPASSAAGGRGQGGRGQGEGGAAGQGQEARPTKKLGAGSVTGGAGSGGGGFAGGGATAGPLVLPGVYSVSLVIDGTTADTKSLRVVADPEVVLTDAERKKLFDMAMEMHELQRRGTDVGNAVMSVNRQMTELANGVNGRDDIPADVKTSFDGLSKELQALVPKLTPPAGGRGGGGGGGRGAAQNESVLARIAQAKTGLMVGMSPTEQTTRAYNEVKTQAPKSFADANAVLSRANALGSTLAKYNVTLTVPAPSKPTSSSTLQDGRR
jgi:hypothetical protein